MPRIEDYVKKPIAKKFKKTPLRPWTFLDTQPHFIQTPGIKKASSEPEDTPPLLSSDVAPVPSPPLSENPSHQGALLKNPLKEPALPSTKKQEPKSNQKGIKQGSNKNQINTNKESIGNQKDTNKEPNRKQKENKKKPTEDHQGTIKGPSRDQLDTIRKSNKNQTEVDSLLNRNQIETKQGSDSESNGDQNRNQSTGPTTALERGGEGAEILFSRLVGLQKKIVLFIGTRCLYLNKTGHSGDYFSSGNISLEEFKVVVDTDIATVKTALQRLVKKGVLLRENGKKGRGGFSSFSISKELYHVLLDEIQSSHIAKHLVEKWESNGDQNRNQDLYSSSSNKTTTTDPLSKFPLWKEVDYSALEKIGFSYVHLLQLIKEDKMTPDMVQDAINFFAFDLEHNEKASHLKQSPLNFFMGILRKGMPYTPPENYESPQERAFRAYAAHKKRQKEKREALEREAFDLAFEEWQADLTQVEIDGICEPPYNKDPESPIRAGYLTRHFQEKIWPGLKEGLIKG